MSTVSTPGISVNPAILAKGKFAQIETDTEKAQGLSLVSIFKGIRGACNDQPIADSFVSIIQNKDETDSKRALKAAKAAGFIEKLYEAVKLYAQVKWELIKTKIGEVAVSVVKGLNLDVSVDSIQKQVDNAIESELESKLTGDPTAAAPQPA